MTRDNNLHPCMSVRTFIVGSLVLAALMSTVQPVFAKRPVEKPTALWNQYPLNVGPAKPPSPTPGHQPSPSPSAASSNLGSRPGDRKGLRQESSNSGFLLVAVVAVLGLSGAVVALVRKRSDQRDLDGIPGVPVAALSASEDSADAGAHPESVNGYETASAPDPPVGEQKAGEGSREQVDSASWSIGRQDAERVLVQLTDGRSLEGYRRATTTARPGLLVLEIVQAFDADGNRTPSSRADSFILPSEIASIESTDTP
jgi:hypothetical protein